MINTIKAELRAAMNGVASRAIRESGMGYKLSYGVELPRLREIAAQFTPDRRLALELWQENVRECKMLAVMLYPLEDFDADMADLWVGSLKPEQADLAGLLCMDLLARAPYAAELAFQWMAEEREIYQLCGFQIVTRLLMQGAQFSPTSEAEFLDQAAATLPTSYLPLKKAVQNALLHYGDTSEEARRQCDAILTA